jgi:hypothetical protein
VRTSRHHSVYVKHALRRWVPHLHCNLQGSAANEAVRRVAQAVAVAWGDTMVRDRGGSATGSDPLRISIGADGRLSAGFVSLARTKALFETESRIEALLQAAAGRSSLVSGGGDAKGSRGNSAGGAVKAAQLRSRLKNVSLIDAHGGAL